MAAGITAPSTREITNFFPYIAKNCILPVSFLKKREMTKDCLSDALAINGAYFYFFGFPNAFTL